MLEEPDSFLSPQETLRALQSMQSRDLPVHTGRTLAYVYSSGRPEVDSLAEQAVGRFAASNALDPTAFPSLQQMENDLVAFAAGLLAAPESAVGTVTSGGTESCLLAVLAARDAHPEIARPRMVVADTVHAAFYKAGHYFGVDVVVVPSNADFRADPAAMAAAIDQQTVLVVASAPSYAHGVVDPVAEIAAAAATHGVRCHVDACIGGWVLPYAARLGRELPAWDFSVPGVTSISVDTHKYAYAPKGTSLLLHRDPSLRKPQFFAWAQWPGYTMLNPTMQSTRSGGPIAGTWAVVESLGDAGYLRLAAETFAAVDAVAAGIEEVDGISLLARPDSTLLALVTDDTLDPFTLADELRSAGWYAQPQMACGSSPANLHLSISAGTAAHAPELVQTLRRAVANARRLGPARVPTELADFIAALDPQELTDADFQGLLVAAGLVGGSLGDPSSVGIEFDLPERMGEINAMLNLAAPKLREALLVAFLDLLSRPS